MLLCPCWLILVTICIESFFLLILDIYLSLPYLDAHGVWHARRLGHWRCCRFSAESRCDVFISPCKHGRETGDSKQAVPRAAAGLTGAFDLEIRCYFLLFLKVIFGLSYLFFAVSVTLFTSKHNKYNLHIHIEIFFQLFRISWICCLRRVK